MWKNSFYNIFDVARNSISNKFSFLLFLFEMEVHNPGINLDLAWVEKVKINLPAVKRRAATLGTKR